MFWAFAVTAPKTSAGGLLIEALQPAALRAKPESWFHCYDQISAALAAKGDQFPPLQEDRCGDRILSPVPVMAPAAVRAMQSEGLTGPAAQLGGQSMNAIGAAHSTTPRSWAAAVVAAG